MSIDHKEIVFFLNRLTLQNWIPNWAVKYILLNLTQYENFAIKISNIKLEIIKDI